MYWTFKILILVRFSHTWFLIGQHSLHNFHLLLTAIRVMDYNMMYGGPNLTRGASILGPMGPQNVKFWDPGALFSHDIGTSSLRLREVNFTRYGACTKQLA